MGALATKPNAKVTNLEGTQEAQVCRVPTAQQVVILGPGPMASLEKGGGLLVARAAIPACHLDRNFCLPNSREMKQMLLFKTLHEGDW